MLYGIGYWGFGGSTRSIHGCHSGRIDIANNYLANNLNRYTHMDDNNSIPSGYNPHYTWAPAIKGGGLAMLDISTGIVSNALMAGGKDCSATITGSGALTNADLAAIVNMIATVTAEGSVNKAQLAGVLAMAASVLGEGTVNYANLGAIIDILATVTASGGVNYANLLGQCFCSAHVYVNEGAATTEQLVDAIWNELTSDHTDVGSMGKALTDAGGAGNPWGSLTAANNDPGTFGALVQETKQKVIGTQGLVLGS